VALLEKRRYLNNRSGDFPQVILIVPSHVPNKHHILAYLSAPVLLLCGHLSLRQSPPAPTISKQRPNS
jgi:hypothetical protein